MLIDKKGIINVLKPDFSSPHRKSLRIPEFDYSLPGAYFVTIVTQGRKQIFGQIVDGEIVLSDTGKMVHEVINQIPEHYLGVNVELFDVMPNHIHALILITDVVAGPRACHMDQTEPGQPQGVAPTQEPLSLPEIVHRIKSLTTHRYLVGITDNGWPRFENRLWHRNYYEHIIRDERDYQAIYEYILSNPMNWEKDEEFLFS